MACHVTRHIASIRAISNATSFLRSLWIQLTSSNATTLRPTGLEPTRSASSLPPLNVTSFDLVTSWSVRRSEVRSGGWKNNRRKNPIAFSIAFSLPMKWPLRCALKEQFYLHIVPRDKLAWFCSTEINRLNTLPEFLSFIHVTRHVTRLLLFTLSIPLGAIVRAVGIGFEVDPFTISEQWVFLVKELYITLLTWLFWYWSLIRYIKMPKILKRQQFKNNMSDKIKSRGSKRQQLYIYDNKKGEN